MNKFLIISLKALRKAYRLLNGEKKSLPVCELDADMASDIIYNTLTLDKPVMVARFGATELVNIVNYIGVHNKKFKNPLTFIQGKTPPWWWEDSSLKQLFNWSGFFPVNVENVEAFSKLSLEDMKEVDVLGSWLGNEKFVENDMHAVKVHLRFLDPFWSKQPWTRVLKDKNILIVHPFIKTIVNQYKKKELLFKDNDILPEFKSLHTVQAVQSLGQGDDRFKDWFEALDYMKSEIDKIDYDICLIGAGAYGFPLAAHVKRQGRKAVHMGGSLQLLFGIRGNRWEDPNYGVGDGLVKRNDYVNLVNDYWVRPHADEKPTGAKNVEGACYW